MKKINELVKKLIPEGIEAFLLRYQVLHAIYLLQPVGRRTIAVSMKLSERTIRGEVEKLASQRLIDVSKLGMNVTEDGKEVLLSLGGLVSVFSEIPELEEQVQNILGVKKVYIVAGDLEQNPWVKKEMGRIAASKFLQKLNKTSKIAVTGGTTIAEVVDAIPQFSSSKACNIVPARGSVGSDVEMQADTLVSKLAKKLCAEFQLLQIPDNFSENALKEIQNEPNINYTISKMQQTDTILFGIGKAMVMARKRMVSERVYQLLEEKNAVAEALGYYFDKQGEIVYQSPSICLSWEKIQQMDTAFAVAGGKNKAECILSVCKKITNCRIVIDEGVAKEIIVLAGQEEMHYN